MAKIKVFSCLNQSKLFDIYEKNPKDCDLSKGILRQKVKEVVITGLNEYRKDKYNINSNYALTEIEQDDWNAIKEQYSNCIDIVNNSISIGKTDNEAIAKMKDASEIPKALSTLSPSDLEEKNPFRAVKS